MKKIALYSLVGLFSACFAEAPLQVSSVSIKPINCVPALASNGTITITASGGVAPYAFTLNDQPVVPADQISASIGIPVASKGKQTIEIFGMPTPTMETTSFSIDPITAPFCLVDIDTFLDCKGTNLSVNLGLPDGVSVESVTLTDAQKKSIEPSGGIDAFLFSGLLPSIYTLTITPTPSAACPAACNTPLVVTLEITQAPVKITSITNTNRSDGQANGELDISFTGGRGPFSVTLSGPFPETNPVEAVVDQINQKAIASGLKGGYYSIALTDGTGSACITGTGLVNFFHNPVSNRIEVGACHNPQ